MLIAYIIFVCFSAGIAGYQLWETWRERKRNQRIDNRLNDDNGGDDWSGWAM